MPWQQHHLLSIFVAIDSVTPRFMSLRTGRGSQIVGGPWNSLLESPSPAGRLLWGLAGWEEALYLWRTFDSSHLPRRGFGRLGAQGVTCTRLCRGFSSCTWSAFVFWTGEEDVWVFLSSTRIHILSTGLSSVSSFLGWSQFVVNYGLFVLLNFSGENWDLE